MRTIFSCVYAFSFFAWSVLSSMVTSADGGGLQQAPHTPV
jgi:hypothetical protein